MQSIGSLMERDIIVALDYFGTGYSSFQNLKNIPVSLLKTERQFVVDIENNDYLKNLFSIMVQLAHAADMRLVAEGIETESQMKLILESGADYIQGYYYSRPLPANEMAKLISNFK
jgi:EAL domain-containing protein (putative c-di-GMP-specific phosphodiesterase class I)